MDDDDDDWWGQPWEPGGGEPVWEEWVPSPDPPIMLPWDPDYVPPRCVGVYELKRARAQQLLLDVHGRRSTRWIAALVPCSRALVDRVRANLERSGQLPPRATREALDGRWRPARRPDRTQGRRRRPTRRP